MNQQKTLAPWAIVRLIKLTEHSSERLMFVMGSRAVDRDCAITDALLLWIIPLESNLREIQIKT